MKISSRTLVTLACAALLSAAVSFPSRAEAKVTRNHADWVSEQEAEAKASEAAQTAAEAVAQAEVVKEAAAQAAAEAVEQTLREKVVNFALSFVGGRYQYGGSDPHTGVDCSGFTRYVLSNAAGISVGRSSRDQAAEGRTISADEMQPGDLLFYDSGSGTVNHVAMYIGNGQIVHASTESTGIKISNWNYRTPVRIASFLG